MLKIKRDINQNDFNIADTHSVKSEYFSFTDTASREWKFQ